MTEAAEFPLPSVLDPEPGHLLAQENSEDAQGRVEALRQALEDACAYGRSLWADVATLREYLLASLPPDPRAPGPHRPNASPTGPDDEPGWQAWIDAYAQATSVLAGPQGDSGYGRVVAKREAEIRRSAPVQRVLSDLQQRTSSQTPAPARRRVRSVAGVALATLLARRLLVGRLNRRG